MSIVRWILNYASVVWNPKKISVVWTSASSMEQHIYSSEDHSRFISLIIFFCSLSEVVRLLSWTWLNIISDRKLNSVSQVEWFRFSIIIYRFLIFWFSLLLHKLLLFRNYISLINFSSNTAQSQNNNKLYELCFVYKFSKNNVPHYERPNDNASL